MRVTFSFDLNPRMLDGLSDFDRRSEGITVAEVAAAVLRHHEPRDGYIAWSIEK